MSENSSRVELKRVNEIPSQFYVQVPQAERTNTATEELKQNNIEEKQKKSVKVMAEDVLSRVLSFGRKTAESAAKKAASLLAYCRENLTEQAKNLMVSIGVSAALIVAAAVLLFVTTSIGYQISANGQVLGTSPSKTAYEETLSLINHELSYVNPDAFSLENVDISLKLVPKGKFTSESDLREALKSVSADMIPAYGIYADGRLLFSMPNEATAKALLDDYQAEFSENRDDVVASFCEDVAIRLSFVPKTSLKTIARGKEQLTEGQMVFHKVANGETLESIAQTYGIFPEELYKTNAASLLADISGKTLRVATGKPLLSVKTTERKTLEEEVPFTTIEQKNPNDYKGNRSTLRMGQTGVRSVDAYVTYINGVESDRKVISETMTQKPIDEIIGLGTKDLPSAVGSGSLAMPVSGSLSSRYGSRWGRNHDGLDFSADTGTAIYAADNGKVIFSEYDNGGYGYMIQIDHGNGIVTYYAHCSELLVPAGTLVSKGDLIAKVGNTGRSTGPHLHFEVRKNGTPVNPANYLKEIA